jgi:cyclohexadienyl dehydratase
MKKLNLIAAAAFAAAALLAVPATAQSSLASILDAGKIRVGTTGDFNPMTVRDIASAGYKGHEIDVATELAKNLGVELEFVPTDWKTMIAGVQADKFDIVMSGTSMNVGRAKVVGFTDPTIYVTTVPMTLTTNIETYKTWDDVNKPGVKVAVILGTIFEEEARAAFPDATIIAVEAPATGYQEVLSGRVDVTITSNVDAASIMEKFPAMGVFAKDEVRNPKPHGYIVQQGNQSLINFMNTWIALKKSSGFYDGLAAKWNL